MILTIAIAVALGNIISAITVKTVEKYFSFKNRKLIYWHYPENDFYIKRRGKTLINFNKIF